MYDAVDVSYGTFYFVFGLSYLFGGFAVVVAVFFWLPAGCVLLA